MVMDSIRNGGKGGLLETAASFQIDQAVNQSLANPTFFPNLLLKRKPIMPESSIMSRTLVIFLLLPIFTFAQSSNPPSGIVERYSPKLDALISKKVRVDTIATGLDWCEGPLWVEQEKMLLFSDVPQNLIYKWTEAGGQQVYLKPSGYTGTIPRGGELGSNGLALSNDGKLLICQDGNRQIAIMSSPLSNPKPDFKVVTDSYLGKKFNSPNDMSIASNGDVYFTDPPYGLEKNMNDPLKEMSYQGVFRVSKNGTIELLTDTIDRPNGIALFPDGKSILIANSFRQKPFIYQYDIDEEGKLQNGRIFYDAREAQKTQKGGCDGLKIDKQGNVYASTPGGISIFTSQGELIGKIRVNPVASNCSLSGDEKTLFITADDHVLRVKMR